jgi:3'-phosphoadenosine 5'-phosphosulfate sulfotransferase (PAPS reductase)/FAD synthetase
MFSGGLGSWAAAKRVAASYGTKNLTLLFSDTLIEDQDLYRFLREAANNVGAPLICVADGRTPWQVYRDERFLGNARIDPCSRVLKREPAARWLKENCSPKSTVVHLGIDWTESHRFERVRAIREKEGWKYTAPLCNPPYLSKDDIFQWLARENIRAPRLYSLGFVHNNCGGFCCKAGQAHFANLLRKLPDRYAEHEAEEIRLRRFLRKNVSILADRRGGGTHKPLTLRDFRRRLKKEEAIDEYDLGGCGCFAGREQDG